MLFRATLAIETRLSSFRPLSRCGASRTRPCLLSQLSGSRGLFVGARLHTGQPLLPSEHAGARFAEEDEEEGPVGDLQASDFKVFKGNARWEQGNENATSTNAEISPWRNAFVDIFHGTEGERTRAMGATLRTEQRAAAMKFASGRSPHEIRECYMAMSKELIHTQLPDILVGCLLVGAEITLRVLKGLPNIRNDFSIRMDCLLKLRRERSLWSEIEAGYRPSTLKSRFYEELKTLREETLLPRYELSAGHAALILEEATTLKQGLRFFGRYAATYSDHATSVVLMFVDFFTRLEAPEYALDALRLIKPAEISASNEEIGPRCVNLLKLDKIDTSGGSKNFQILPQLLELGIKPTIYIHNMIIMNAIKANVHRVAWDLYEYLKAENLETNSITHLLLLKDAFARQDVSSLNEILSAIHKRQDLYHDPHLVGCTMNIIRIIYTYEKRASPVETFSHILSIHNRAWLSDIYISLRMIQPPPSRSILISPDNPPLTNPDNHPLFPTRSPTLEPPPPESIAWTILQYCLAQQFTAPVSSLWTRLTTAILASDPWILPAASLENLYAGFIIFYGRSPRNLGKAVDVVQFMLDNSHICPPTGFTWTRLMCAYLRQGQHVEAEQIRGVMERKGIEIGGREWAFLLENWPESEVVERARRAVAEVELEEGQVDAGDEELFEGVGERSALEDEDESVSWDGILDLRKQAEEAEHEVERVNMEQLKGPIDEVDARRATGKKEALGTVDDLNNA